jgi:FAD/FMN-containing dehydrogenase
VLGSAAVAGTLLAPGLRLPPGSFAAGPAPPRFPEGIELYKSTFENWALEIIVPDLWTCAPRTPKDVVRLANWAHRHGWRLRPRGKMHGWSPLTVQPRARGLDRIVLVDTTQHLTAFELLDSPSAVRAQAGVTIDDLVPALKSAGQGFGVTPATGNVTVGGALAIGAHGASLPGRGEPDVNGHTHGSYSNLVLSLTAVVWDRNKERYRLRVFDRQDPDCKALLVNLGRTFVTEATLRTGPEQKLRCVSYTDIPVSRMFAEPGSTGSDRFSDFVDETGRAESILFPHTDEPWLKVWSLSPQQPTGSRRISDGYPYVFSDNVPPEVTNPAGRIVAGDSQLTPAFGRLLYTVASNGLRATASTDIWGSANDVTRYIKATTLRYCELGFTVVTSRERIQHVLSGFTHKVRGLSAEYEARGLYPLNGPIELRVCGLDDPGDSGAGGADSPVLSPTRPVPRRPDWNVAIWTNVLTFAATPGAQPFLRELQQWLLAEHRGEHSIVRPEWSKGWAYSGKTLWSDRRVLRRVIPRAISAGRRRNDDWDWAVTRLDHYDPHRVFSNSFMDRFLR